MQTMNNYSGCEESILKIEESKDLKVIKILSECTFQELNEYRLNIPMNLLIKNRYGKSGELVKPQKVYVIENNGITYYIVKSDDDLIISERDVKLDTRYTTFKINLANNNFSASMHIFDLNNVIKLVKYYPSSNENFSLEKKDALDIISQLLTRLRLLPNINNILNFSKIYSKVGIVDQSLYFPVISDDVITLSWNYRKSNDINLVKEAYLDVVLNETKEKVGFIFFNYGNTPGFSYEGNVGYGIKINFRNNHYATRALKLLKELVKDNKAVDNKNLYVSTLPSNEVSQRVVLNNGGKIDYSGKVPESDPIYIMEGVEEVVVYKIKL